MEMAKARKVRCKDCDWLKESGEQAEGHVP